MPLKQPAHATFPINVSNKKKEGLVFCEQKDRGKAGNLKEKGWQTWLAREVSRKQKKKRARGFQKRRVRENRERKKGNEGIVLGQSVDDCVVPLCLFFFHFCLPPY